MAKTIKCIAAIDDKRGLSKDGDIPWNIAEDRQFFRDSISTGVGLMGWNTFESNGLKPFPTSPRNVVLTHNDGVYQGVELIHDLDSFLDRTDDDIWIIGGGELFEQVLHRATHLYLTRVSGDFGCDVFFPEFEDTFRLVEKSEQHTAGVTDYVYELWQPLTSAQ